MFSRKGNKCYVDVTNMVKVKVIIKGANIVKFKVYVAKACIFILSKIGYEVEVKVGEREPVKANK